MGKPTGFMDYKRQELALIIFGNDLDKFFDVTVPVCQNPAGNTAAGIFCVFQDHFLQLHGIIDFLQLFQQYDFFVTVARKGTVFI